MTKLLAYRATATALLITFGSLLAACGQQSNPSSNTSASSTATGNTAVISTPNSNTSASNTATGDTPVSNVPADTKSLEATIVSGMATATVLAGIGGNTPQSGLDLASLDPCKLLTQDDVKSAMGAAPYAPRQMSQTTYHTGCSYVEPTLEENSPRLSLSLDTIDTWELHTHDVQTVSGVGDQAETHEFSGWRSLWVLLKNKVVVQVDIYPPDVEKAKQLTQKAIGRLP